MASNMRHKVFVGLGNIGKRYEKTRHNMGFMIVDRLAERLGLELNEASRFKAKVAKGVVGQVTVHLLEPTTYMNASGQAIESYMKYFHLPVDDLCVVTDDVALPFGNFRFRKEGSSGGHNGLKSVEQHLGSRQYARFRIGIAGEHHGKKPLDDYVLENFSRSELNELPDIIERAADTLEKLLTQDVESVMNEVNTRVKQVSEKKRQENKDESNTEKSL